MWLPLLIDCMIPALLPKDIFRIRSFERSFPVKYVQQQPSCRVFTIFIVQTVKYNGQKRNWWAHQKQQLPHTTLCPLTSTRWIETKINKRTQHFFCVFHKKWTTALKLKSQKFDEQSWYPPKLIELCMVAMLWRHGLIKFDNCSGLAMFWTFRSHVRLNIVTVNLLESFSLHWSFYRTNLNARICLKTHLPYNNMYH